MNLRLTLLWRCWVMRQAFNTQSEVFNRGGQEERGGKGEGEGEIEKERKSEGGGGGRKCVKK